MIKQIENSFVIKIMALAVFFFFLALTLLLILRRPNKTLVQQGREIAKKNSCFECHGSDGRGGIPKPGCVSCHQVNFHRDVFLSDEASRGMIPGWSETEMSFYAKNEEEIREWIMKGKAKRYLKEETGHEREMRLAKMPAYGGKLKEREINALVVYLKALSWFDDPGDKAVWEGRRLARRFGCFGCHGPEGRGGGPNKGSLKGYIPGWNGLDFKKLIHSDRELEEWILDGISQRFRGSRLKRFFLERAVIQMPAYRKRMKTEELKKIKAYIHSLN